MTQTPNRPLPCIKCGTVLDNVGQRPDDDTPHAGTVFTSYGNYGSTVFDPMSSQLMLELVVCDSCLVEAANARCVHHVTLTRPAPAREVRFFSPGQVTA